MLSLPLPDAGVSPSGRRVAVIAGVGAAGRGVDITGGRRLVLRANGWLTRVRGNPRTGKLHGFESSNTKQRRGRNNTVASRNGTRHAELEAIDRMLDVDGVPPESLGLRVSRVVFGAANDKFGGCGSVLSLHADGGASAAGDPPYPAVGGVRKAEAVALLRLFYAQENQNAPQPQKRTRKQLELGAEAARETQRLPGSERGGREPDS
ncbi:hypothetical protein EMIHUDRAFT_219331 [Emiliania huxleyi CCMP1516]|uniref:Uncharacterized protein n=2 Tax=Emiliania huxleyi TaxID=2903 RepID=A0A0D3I588_EMIH1|nr:hypothetical protein EMIHUDRAFT_219331 [Emiliania huxleyi CCMP1516]EOD06423.1 hypothetical protein EMIHUDRAFT_219331 [Emiliania huxleyi CCMP1516]|eukprot:XP_005758852.1 hypothetical protein EMIHUDRAFT_219331 [Emiliania huxleyi CCMP1516]